MGENCSFWFWFAMMVLGNMGEDHSFWLWFAMMVLGNKHLPLTSTDTT